jgi:hypothetical protein
LSADVKKQLHQRIVCLKHVGFVLTWNHVRRFPVQICKEHSMQIQWNCGMVGKVWFISFLRRNANLTLRKAENLSYGRLVGLNTDLVDDLFKLSRQTMEAMKLHQRPHFIYNLDETELQLTCISDNQNCWL